MIVLRASRFAVLVGALVSTLLAQSKPVISSEPPTYSTASGTLFVYLPIANTGSAEANSVQVTSATVGTAKLLTPALPLGIGNLAGGASYGLTLTFNPVGLAPGKIYLVTVHGTYHSSTGVVPFSLNQSLKYGILSPFAQPVKPLTVNPTPDGMHSAMQVISAALGGTVTATGTDGSVFTLSVPPNALLSDEAITMTPLSAVAGLPVTGGLLAGVEFSPEGLQFQQPATLTIQPAAKVPASDLVGFGYYGGGQDFHLQPVQSNGTVTMSILHFSGAGVAQGNILMNNVGNPTVADQLNQQAAQDVNIAFHCAGAVACQLAWDAVEGLSQEYYIQVVQPLAEQALTDATVAQAALKTITVWENQVQVLGYFTHKPFDSELETLAAQVSQILINVYNTTYRNCSSETSQTQRFKDARTMLSIVKRFVVTGQNPFPDWATQVATCYAGTLNLNMDSKVSTTTTIPTPAGDITQKTDSEVAVSGLSLKFTAAALGYQGQGPLNYPVFTFSAAWPAPIGDCSSGRANDPGSVQVTGTIDLNFFFVPSLSDVPIHLTITPNVTETLDLGVYGPMTPCESAIHQTADYVSGLNVVHKNPTDTPQPTSYVMPVNSTKTFSGSGTYSTSTSTMVATENTELTLQQANQ